MTVQRIVDLSHQLDEATPVYPGDPPLEVSVLETTRDMRRDRRALNSSRVSLGTHCGTHMDAPFHFFDEGRPIDQVPLERLVGPALLIDLRSASAGGSIETAHLQAHRARLEQVRRAVLFTGWSRQWGRPEYFSDHPVMSEEAAELLVACGVQLVGVDTPSVDRPPFPAHSALLGKDVFIVENLTNLEALAANTFHLAVIPLKLTGREASPARAIAWEL